MRFLFKKGNKQIPVYENEHLIDNGILISQTTASITAAGHFILNGHLSRFPHAGMEYINIEIWCSLEDAEGNILFSQRDPRPKNFAENSTESFSVFI